MILLFFENFKIRKDRKIMKIEYRFVTGEKVTAEISDEFKDVVIELDKEEYNCNRKETRKHKSLSLSDKSIENMSISSDICDDVFKNIDKEKLHKAISLLKPDEQELLHNLYLNDKPITQNEYANILHINEKSVQEKSRRIRKKLKKFLKTED